MPMESGSTTSRWPPSRACWSLPPRSRGYMAEKREELPLSEGVREAVRLTSSPNVYLDRVAQNVAAGTPVVLREGDTWMIGRVVSTEDVSVSAFTVSGRVTKLHLADAPDGASFGLRTTTVYLQAEELP